MFMAEHSNRPLAAPEEKELSRKKMGNNSVVTPISLNSGRITRRSPTISYSNGDNARTNTSEKADSANTSQPTISRYLRPSTGSCHDLCKYGRRHASEEEVSKPFRERTATSSLNELKSVEIIVSGEQRKNKIKHKLFVDTNNCSVLVKPSPDAKSFLSKVMASSDAKNHSRRLDASSGGKTLSPKSPTKKFTSLETLEKVEVQVKEGKCTDNNMSIGDKKTSDKLSTSVRSKLVKAVKPLSTSDNSDSVHLKLSRNSDVRTGMNMSASVVSTKKIVATPLSPKGSIGKTTSNITQKSRGMKFLSPGKDRNRINGVVTEISNCQVFEKTLHVTETEMRNNPLSPHVSLSYANPSPLFLEEDDEGIKNTASVEIGKVEHVEENYKNLELRKNENALEIIVDNVATPARLSSSSPISFFHENPSSIFSEDDEEIKYSSSGSDEFVTDNIISTETRKVRDVQENLNKTPSMETENNKFKSTPNGHAIPSLQSSLSSKSNEEDNENIENIGKEADKLVPCVSVTVEIIKNKLLKENHNKNLRKITVVSSGDKYRRPVKLKLGSGKVVNLHQDSKVPRRLRFRKASFTSNKSKISISDNKKAMENGNILIENNKNLYGKALRKNRVVVPEDKSRSPARVFKNGRRLSLQSENNIPWRIRFRKARIIRNEGGKDNLKNISKNGFGEDDAYLSSRKANLKHQDLQQKRYVQFLLNNIIEETASKLVESRKSKVKALVGAFETVISLQECKPSPCSAS